MGFDCLTSSTCLENGSLLMKRTRTLPTVGCEADAVVPEVKEYVYVSGEEAAINGGFADGTVNCGPACITDDHAQRWHICLVDPSNDARSRIRVEFGLVNEPFGAVTMFVEHWDAPYCRGEILPGCGGSNQSFATDPPIDPASALSGTWAVDSQVYMKSRDGWVLERLSSEVSRKSEEAGKNINVALPRGVSLGIISHEDGSKCVAAGWVVKEGVRVVSRRTYDSGGELVSVCRDIEKKLS